MSRRLARRSLFFSVFHLCALLLCRVVIGVVLFVHSRAARSKRFAPRPSGAFLRPRLARRARFVVASRDSRVMRRARKTIIELADKELTGSDFLLQKIRN